MPERMTDNVIILGPKEYLSLPPYLASADLGLCFYYDEELGVKFYRSPLKLFDYMASGLPVIASKVGQIAEVIKDQHNGILIENNNIDEIVKNILFFKNNPGRAGEIAVRGSLRCRRHFVAGLCHQNPVSQFRPASGRPRLLP